MLLSVDASNLIKITDGGVYASVDLAYDNALNKLTLTTSNGKKEFSLTNQSFLESISYDSVQKKIILRVKLSNNDIVVQEIGVSDLFNPINVENISNSPIVLEKTSNDITGIDTVSAKLNVVASDDNLLKVLTDGSTATLFASNHAEDIMVDWYTVDKNGDITDPERIGVQEGFIRTVRYLNDNTAINDEIKEQLVIAYERIGTLEAEVAELTDYVKKLTNFGYTEDLFVDENQTNA
jgi:hypothetical protein